MEQAQEYNDTLIPINKLLRNEKIETSTRTSIKIDSQLYSPGFETKLNDCNKHKHIMTNLYLALTCFKTERLEQASNYTIHTYTLKQAKEQT